MLCRGCAKSDVQSFLQLGKMPLANRLIAENSLILKEPRFNLELTLCVNCGLVQLLDTVSPEELFSEYLYFSSNSDTMLLSANRLVNNLIPTLPADALIIEIASNDGYLLKNYVERSFKVLGIEPAQNIATVANARGINTRGIFFNEQTAQDLIKENLFADVIHANNVMAHVPDINGFIKSLKMILKKEGQAIIEVPYLLDMIHNCEFDTIYHEHVYYFSLTALKTLFEKHHLEIVNLEKLTIHGGSLRVYVKHSGNNTINIVVNDFLEKEHELGIKNVKFYQNLAQKILVIKNKLTVLLRELKNQGKKIAAYGASAKGATLLNYFNIGQNELAFVVDRSVAKQGYYTPGTSLKIHAPEELMHQKVDYALLLTWNFVDEILQQQESFRKMGGKFIVPIPDVRVI